MARRQRGGRGQRGAGEGQDGGGIWEDGQLVATKWCRCEDIQQVIGMLGHRLYPFVLSGTDFTVAWVREARLAPSSTNRGLTFLLFLAVVHIDERTLAQFPHQGETNRQGHQRQYLVDVLFKDVAGQIGRQIS